MDKLKYIVDEYNNIAIFSPTATHQDVARTMSGKPVGAGFCTITLGDINELFDIDEKTIHCYGESVSLNHLQSRGVVDAKAIFKAINPHFYID